MKQMGGPETPGVGWAFGVDRLMLVLENTFVAKQVEKVALIPVGDHLTAAALALMQTLRHKGIACEMTYSGHVGKRLKYAHKIGCTQAIIFGDEEWSQGNVLLRNLQFDDVDGKEQLVSVENLLKTEKVLKSRCST
jgi:histidyl-tRNA synthetase